ncbi:DUF5655 domain-containing protein [Dysosmobacter sp.]|jgi:hypothetical protein|uniref:DUF5655 domain-containing protein n=1 Tax=Dysosmobacter sp. TaxID=2591382 RepID=UPI003D8CA6E8
MNYPAYYEADVLRYFSANPTEQALYELLVRQMDACMPEASVKVQKSQISFYDRHLFAAASIPLRRKKDWPNTCLLVTFGLSHRVEDPRIAVAVEPYPNRWTHHVLISEPDQIDAQLMAWLEEARAFARSKR